MLKIAQLSHSSFYRTRQRLKAERLLTRSATYTKCQYQRSLERAGRSAKAWLIYHIFLPNLHTTFRHKKKSTSCHSAEKSPYLRPICNTYNDVNTSS